MPGPSPAQYYATVVASIVSSLLSLAGSSAVIIASFKASRDSNYQRLVLSLSVADALSSFTNIFHPFMLPRYVREAAGLLWASGNEATCSAAGFFFVLGPALVSFFSLYLSAYFFIKVRYNLQDEFIKKSLILPGSVFALVVCFGFAITGVATNGYGPRVYHNVCSFGDCEIGMLEECEFETGLSWYLGWIHVALIVLPALISLGFTVAVYFSVKAKLQATQRFSFENCLEENKLLTATRSQAFWYALAYWNSFIWYLVFGIVGGDDFLLEDNEGKPGYFSLQLLSWWFFPLQGFVNFIVYTRPRYLQWRQSSPDKSIFFAFRQAISLQPVGATAQIRSSRLTSGSGSQRAINSSQRWSLRTLSSSKLVTAPKDGPKDTKDSNPGPKETPAIDVS